VVISYKRIPHGFWHYIIYTCISKYLRISILRQGLRTENTIHLHWIYIISNHKPYTNLRNKQPLHPLSADSCVYPLPSSCNETNLFHLHGNLRHPSRSSSDYYLHRSMLMFLLQHLFCQVRKIG
jgi:hypothetical protein